jgi:LDH2 family malate/lactate/ureidoglycolate dehydrogenase
MDRFFSFDELFDFTEQVFLKIGCPAADAKLAAETLLSADLRGVDSHGVARLSGYVRLWKAKRINANPKIEIVHERPGTAVVDGDSGLGLVVAPKAMQIAIDKGLVTGAGYVSVRNSNHFGIAGVHAMMALQHDMIGMAMTNASALVAPTFSKQRMLGTNPIAVAIPAGTEQPFVADFATTTASNGKLEILQRKDQPAPIGWVQTAEGQPSRHAHALKDGGALLPLGGSREGASHKGYMLGSIVDIFSGVLSGANYGPWVPPFPAYVPMPEHMPGKGIGHFFGAMRIDGFREAGDFKKDMDQWIRAFRNAKPVNGHDAVVIPGDPEREYEKERSAHGIPLNELVVEDLKDLAKRLSLKF